ncbi:glycerol-3-phosphate acyltransferase PlsY [Pilibacter termitis]|uniref:Glycerol-3-phosphate acyltransferase n=1 Tax=Pilibacter termitis TaxID=263852 RepID=A0A1T4K7Q8_9ENTE|nr:glycerol-3-phosphate 1-O-acyltransferase PlsY [Pilibacter termitis]SJZ38480.1 glycerol-3-phosphate acyltransferase PlsY [Pilibacter termitis]
MVIPFLLLLAYLFGSIPSGVWIGKKFFDVDIRQFGSGNIGTTNTFRVLGKRAGVVVLLCDMFKGTLATLLPVVFHVNNISPVVFGIFAILGHTFSIFVRFKGGKAVATSAGMLLGVAPMFFVYVMVIFTISLFLTSMVSFSSIAAAAFGFLGVLLFPVFHCPILANRDWLFTVLIVLLALFIVLRHRENIERMKKREENTIGFGLNLLKNGKKAEK